MDPESDLRHVEERASPVSEAGREGVELLGAQVHGSAVGKQGHEMMERVFVRGEGLARAGLVRRVRWVHTGSPGASSNARFKCGKGLQ